MSSVWGKVPSTGGTCKNTLIEWRNEGGESHYIVVPKHNQDHGVVNWLFRKPLFSQNGICSAWSRNVLSPAPSSHLFPLAAGLYKTKLGPNEKNVHQTMPSLLLFFEIHSCEQSSRRDFWSKPFIIHHASSRPLPTIKAAFFTSLSSFIEEPNTAQCLHGSVREAWSVSVFCAPLSCSPFAFTGVWCLCARNSVHKHFLKPSQTMPANNLFWKNPMLSRGHYQLKLKYDLLYVKPCTKIQIDFEKRRTRNSHPNTFRQIHTNPTNPTCQKDPKCQNLPVPNIPNQWYQFTEISISQHVLVVISHLDTALCQVFAAHLSVGLWISMCQSCRADLMFSQLHCEGSGISEPARCQESQPGARWGGHNDPPCLPKTKRGGWCMLML